MPAATSRTIISPASPVRWIARQPDCRQPSARAASLLRILPNRPTPLLVKALRSRIAICRHCLEASDRSLGPTIRAKRLAAITTATTHDDPTDPAPAASSPSPNGGSTIVTWATLTFLPRQEPSLPPPLPAAHLVSSIPRTMSIFRRRPLPPYLTRQSSWRGARPSPALPVRCYIQPTQPSSRCSCRRHEGQRCDDGTQGQVCGQCIALPA